MIRAKQLPRPLMVFCAWLLTVGIRWWLNKRVINSIHVRPGHSVLLMCNHFGFGDGFLAIYLAWHGIHKVSSMKGLYIMSVEKQLKSKMWLRYFGSFSIGPGINGINESLEYAAELLNTPGNILLFYPQGNLESNHVRTIVFQEGLNHLVPKIKGDCQIIWSSNIVEFFESLKPSVYFSLLDCGTNREFNFEATVTAVNKHHQQALDEQLRFTPPGSSTGSE